MPGANQGAGSSVETVIARPYNRQSGNGQFRGFPSAAQQNHTRRPLSTIREDIAVGFERGVDNGQGASQALVRDRNEVLGASETPQGQQLVAQEDEYIASNRFIPLTWQSIRSRFLEELCTLFKVKRCKVKDWLADELIRLDVKAWKEGDFPYDVEPLLRQMAPKDIERWDRLARSCQNNLDLAKAIGPRGGSYEEFSSSYYSHHSSHPRYSRYPQHHISRAFRYNGRCFECFSYGEWCGGRFHKDYFGRLIL